MDRLIILVGRLYKSVALTKYFFKVSLLGHFMPLGGMIRLPVESPLYAYRSQRMSDFVSFSGQFPPHNIMRDVN